MNECMDSGDWVPPQYRFGEKGWCGNCGGYVRITAKTETDYPRYTPHKKARRPQPGRAGSSGRRTDGFRGT